MLPEGPKGEREREVPGREAGQMIQSGVFFAAGGVGWKRGG